VGHTKSQRPRVDRAILTLPGPPQNPHRGDVPRIAQMGAFNLQASPAATVLRYVDGKFGEREETYAPDPVDYLAAPVGGKPRVAYLTCA
jgi:hypothetical protein